MYFDEVCGGHFFCMGSQGWVILLGENRRDRGLLDASVSVLFRLPLGPSTV